MTDNRANRLEVRVWDKTVGVLEKVTGLKHVFSYLPDTPLDHFVSLTMPVRGESYVWENGLHPPFQMNLAEGYRKDLLREQFGPVATVDDFSLLALTGASTLGRVTVHPLNRDINAQNATHGSVAEVLARQDSRSALLEYLRTTALDSISGVMPKALAADERITLRTLEWILKTGRADTPGICVNEYVCLELARRINLPVPAAKLADDGEVLAIGRFDLDQSKRPLGLEDFCSLLGMAPHEKYDATAERMAYALLAFVATSEKLDSSKRFLDMLILNAAIRNADAHSKNYSLLYSHREDVRLAPVYDVITVHAYPPYAKNPYPVSIGGTKGWNLRKPLERFAAERLNLDPSQVGRTIERISLEMTAVAPLIGELASKYRTFREPAKALLHAWQDGIATLGTKSNPVHVDFSSAKLSEPRQNRNPRRRIAR